MFKHKNVCQAILEENNAYLELNSVFKKTGKIRNKYKLLLKKTILDQYFFYTTTNNIAVLLQEAELTLTIEPKDWSNVVDRCVFRQQNTYISLRHCDVMLIDEIYQKFCNNEFLYQAALSKAKRLELEEKSRNLGARLRSKDVDAMNFAEFALLGIKSFADIQEALKNLNLD